MEKVLRDLSPQQEKLTRDLSPQQEKLTRDLSPWKEIEMKYLVVGAGGTGGVLGFSLAQASRDVTLIARGEHLAAIQEKGLTLSRQWCHTRQRLRVKTMAAEDYQETPDVILVCVKYYSLEEIIPFLRRAAGPETIILPILNVFGTGKMLQPEIPDSRVLDGCIYVAASIAEPGMIRQQGEILRVIFGARTGEEIPDSLGGKLAELEADMRACGIDAKWSRQVEKDCLGKFSYVSPAGAAGLFWGATAGDFQKDGPQREMLIALIREIRDLAAAMGYPFDKDYVKINLDIMSKLDPKADTSMQRDVAAGRSSEIDGLIYEVVRLGDQYHAEIPTYRTLAGVFEKKSMGSRPVSSEE